MVATAVVEEGLDVPKCNLVFRFNKPPNFSSYMQSKGRARAKQNAAYVLLIDEIDTGKDLSEYRNYEELEKVIFSLCFCASEVCLTISIRRFKVNFLSMTEVILIWRKAINWSLIEQKQAW